MCAKDALKTLLRNFYHVVRGQPVPANNPEPAFITAPYSFQDFATLAVTALRAVDLLDSGRTITVKLFLVGSTAAMRLLLFADVHILMRWHSSCVLGSPM